MTNAARLTNQAGPMIDKIGRSAESINTMGKEVSRTSVNAGKTLNSLGASLHGFTDVSLPELDRLIGEMNAMAASMRRLSEQTERNPDSLLFGIKPVPDGPGEKSTEVRKP
jgi:phospholipid/cholesterol/gamma-HCH transport system substrate-binding protein